MCDQLYLLLSKSINCQSGDSASLALTKAAMKVHEYATTATPAGGGGVKPGAKNKRKTAAGGGEPGTPKPAKKPKVNPTPPKTTQDGRKVYVDKEGEEARRFAARYARPTGRLRRPAAF